MRLYICIPSHDMVCTDFMLSVTAMLTYLFTHKLVDGEMSFRLLNQRGALIHMTREEMVQQGLVGGATHFLFIDSDMMFPEDALHRLFSRNEPIVAANYVQRCLPTKPNAVSMLEGPMFTDPDSTGLEEAKSVGLGLALIRSEVFESMPRPWFDTYWYTREDGKMSLIGEDVFFCHKCRHSNYKIMIDHDLSKEVTHLGMFEFVHPMARVE